MDKHKVLRTVPDTWQALQVNSVDAGVDEMETLLSIWYFFIIFFKQSQENKLSDSIPPQTSQPAPLETLTSG